MSFLTATAVAEAVNTHVNITAFNTVGAEITAHLIFVGGIYRLTLIYAVICGTLRVVIDFFVELFISFLVLLVVGFKLNSYFKLFLAFADPVLAVEQHALKIVPSAPALVESVKLALGLGEVSLL